MSGDTAPAKRGRTRWLFFRPGDLRDLAVTRIVLAAAYLLVLDPGLSQQLWLASEGSGEAFLALPALKVLMLPFGAWGERPEPWLVAGVWWTARLAAALVLIGLFTRWAGFLWAAGYSFLVAHGYSFAEFHHPEAPFAIALWLLAFSRWDAALSLDALRRRLRRVEGERLFRPAAASERTSPEATWPLMGILAVLALCYLSAGVYKLAASGVAWLNGDTLAFYLVRDGIRWDRPLALALADVPGLMVALSALTYAFELTFWVAVLWPVAALVYVPFGLGLHAGIWILMRATFPHWMALYIAFLPQLRTGWRSVRARMRARSADSKPETGRPFVIGYDGGCRLCLRTMAVLDELDGRGRLSFVDARHEPERVAPELAGMDALHAMRVVEPDGSVRSGFHAFRSLAGALPALWPLVPLLRLPGAAWLGSRAYAAVARRRHGCTDGACAVRAGAAQS